MKILYKLKASGTMFFFFPVLFIFIISACHTPQRDIEITEFEVYYKENNVKGSFLLYDPKNNEYICYNRPFCIEPLIPASTFKICNSLIGLETGVIRNENFMLHWDGIERPVLSWNQDQDLKSAFKNSTVWYYQELARRVGSKRMKYWLDKAHYGNADTSGGIDRFWLSGGLRITCQQQIDFLRRLHDNELPFSQRTMDIVKKIMIRKDTNGIVLRGKTGWGEMGNRNIGWFTGWVESGNQVWYFANDIQDTIQDNPSFPAARIEITMQILKNLKILPVDY